MVCIRRLTWLAVALAFMITAVETTSAAAFKRVKAGDAAPGFTLPDLDGVPVTLDEYRGSPLTAVCFWAMWSPKSALILGDLGRLAAEFGTNGFRVLAINAEGADAPSDLSDRIRSYLAEHQITGVRIVVDRDLEQYSTWGVIATPATAFLDADLVIGYEFSGRPSSAYEDMRDHIRQVLGLAEAEAERARPKRERYRADKRLTLHYGLAHTLYARGQFSKAARKLKKVIKQDPDFPDAHALMGAIDLGLASEGRKGAEDKARASFDKAVQLDGTVPMGLAGQAHFALEDGDLVRALDLCRKAVSYTEDADLPALPPLPPRSETTETEAPASDAGEAPAEPAGGEKPPGNTAGAEEESEAGQAGADEGAQPAGGTQEVEPVASVAEIGPAQAAPQAPTVLAYLDRAGELLADGQEEPARDLLARVIRGLLALPEKSGGGKGDPMERMRRMKQGQKP